jgi:hypothetical protein
MVECEAEFVCGVSSTIDLGCDFDKRIDRGLEGSPKTVQVTAYDQR